ncbi:5-formyltetrahydrofolate cyclo-ligase [Ephemeroptericola cinctiostellae]|uniref:5-formyltetrahydrofolate cyclo-ligase n=1 Tax=Ephemeroptericola cinctiostellae TaxID=2268024 RepID=A0A345DC75_9BURK|nr:5-formyltetrahydrofolate cyclo-ligase [Ephemeroptericola cinctiostellae]AXF85963.1 5-formyltetrahydrofolate cyclo-ligase [Ephemeroptericola cinctiostellae]
MTTHNADIVTVNEVRRALRAQLLNERQQILADDKAMLDAVLCESLMGHLHTLSPKPQCIALYWPIRGEPDLMPFAHAWLAAGGGVVLPMVVEKHAPLKFGVYTQGTELKTGAYGIPEPDLLKLSTQAPDVVVIPCVGFNDANYRLGYGGGYYDRTLAGWRDEGASVHSVGVAYGAAQVSFEPGGFDLPLDVILSA